MRKTGVTARLLALIAEKPGITGPEISARLDIKSGNVRPLLATYLENGRVTITKVVTDSGSSVNAYRMTAAGTASDDDVAAGEDDASDVVTQRTVPATTAPRVLDIPSFTNSPFPNVALTSLMAGKERDPDPEPAKPVRRSSARPAAAPEVDVAATPTPAPASSEHLQVLKRVGLFNDGTAVLEFERGAPIYLSARCAEAIADYLSDPWREAMAALESK